jgi:hypothetical protein
MKTFHCQCGQALTMVVTGIPGTPFTVSRAAAARQLSEALDRHLPHCPVAELDEAQAS